MGGRLSRQSKRWNGGQDDGRRGAATTAVRAFRQRADGEQRQRPRATPLEVSRLRPDLWGADGHPMAHLHTEAREVAQALLVVMRRGSLRAAEEVTGHKYETISRWLQKALAHAEAVTAVLVQEVQLSAVEVDEFWSFVERKAAGSKRGHQPAVERASGEGVTAWIGPAAS